MSFRPEQDHERSDWSCEVEEPAVAPLTIDRFNFWRGFVHHDFNWLRKMPREYRSSSRPNIHQELETPEEKILARPPASKGTELYCRSQK